MIILYNISKTNKLTFDFGSSVFTLTNNRPLLMCGDEFIIEPLSSTIEPNGFIELKLSLSAAKEPSVYEGEMECAITWDLKEDDSKRNNPSINASSQHALEKETLFLRVKKTSKLDVELINSFKESEQ